jgi:prolyl-tRNA synthetase
MSDVGVTVKKTEDFSEWYTEVILKSGLADYAPIKGCMIIREDAIAMWEKIQEVLNKKLPNVHSRRFPKKRGRALCRLHP